MIFMVIKNIYEVIDMIRSRPGMYLGEFSVSKLKAFLSGYCSAVWLNKCVEFENQNKLIPLPFKFFNNFTARKFNVPKDIGWCGIILQQVGNNEKKGLELFFELLDEYKSITVTHCFCAALTKENIDCLCEKEANGFIQTSSWQCIDVPDDKANVTAVYLFELSKWKIHIVGVEGNDTLQVSWYDDKEKNLHGFLEKIFGKLNFKDADWAEDLFGERKFDITIG